MGPAVRGNQLVVRGATPQGVRQWARNVLLATVPASRLVAHARGESGAVYLTFDDGPHPEHTPALLDVLSARGARATFFVLGTQAVRHPDLVRRIVDEGHRLANHSYWHGRPELTTADALLNEVRVTRDALQRICGVRPALFRPPHGKLTPAKLLRLWSARQRVVLWNVDPRDYDAQAPEELDGFFRDHPLRPGDIVLLHDVTPHAARVLPRVIADAQRQGLRFEALPE